MGIVQNCKVRLKPGFLMRCHILWFAVCHDLLYIMICRRSWFAVYRDLPYNVIIWPQSQRQVGIFGISWFAVYHGLPSVSEKGWHLGYVLICPGSQNVWHPGYVMIYPQSQREVDILGMSWFALNLRERLTTWICHDLLSISENG